mmetsp:Transcript_11890/g.15424  ORF Transcript_11890/g.15424 Transcript_11890/m.15424 type:complete len:130 (-) Transcript_11890:1515-1904(-)
MPFCLHTKQATAYFPTKRPFTHLCLEGGAAGCAAAVAGAGVAGAGVGGTGVGGAGVGGAAGGVPATLVERRIAVVEGGEHSPCGKYKSYISDSEQFQNLRGIDSPLDMAKSSWQSWRTNQRWDADGFQY